MATFTIPSIFKAVDKFSPVLKTMAGNTETFAARTERQMRKVGDTAMTVSKNAAIIGAAIALPLIAAANSAVKFEAQMSNVATLLDTNKENMTQMGDAVLGLATKLPVPIEELTQSLYDIRSSGIGADRAMQTLEVSAKLSAAGLATAAESTNILTSAMNAFQADGLTTAQTADYLFKTVKAGKTTLSQLAQSFGATAPIVQSAGVTLADFQAATAALTLSGTPASQAQNQIKASMISLMKPTSELDKIMKQLGVKTSAELIKKSGGMVGAFRAVSEQGKKMGINMAKAWGSTEALAAVTPLLDSASTAGVAYAGALEDMLHGSNAVDSAFEKQNKTSKAQLQLMKNNIEVLAISIGSVLLPILNKLIQKVIPMAQAFVKWSQENPKLFKGLVIGAAVLAAFAFAVAAVSFAVGLASKVMVAWGVVTKAIIVAQWAWNAAMTANPIGLVIVGVAALIALVAVMIVHWDEWGAAAMAALGMIMPPLAILISIVMAFSRNWDMIVASFKNGGILEGIKAIGKTLLDVVLMPLQQILEIVAKLTGSDIAASAAKQIEAFRKDLGVSMENGADIPVVNTDKNRQDTLVQKMTQTNDARVQLNVNDPTGRATATSDSPMIKINSTSTTGLGG